MYYLVFGIIFTNLFFSLRRLVSEHIVWDILTIYCHLSEILWNVNEFIFLVPYFNS